MDKLAKTISWWRHQGYAGGYIGTHRSMRTSRPEYLPVLFLLPALIDVVLWRLLDTITALWLRVGQFWFDKLKLDGTVVLLEERLTGFVVLRLPRAELRSGAPDNATWWITLAATAGVLSLSFFIRSSQLQIRYFLRALAFTQATALAYFAIAPQAFPYDLPRYLTGTLEARLVFIALLPWLFCFTYYLFEFSVWQKAGLTLLAMGYFVALTPFQFVLQALLLHRVSLLFLPILSLVFGTVLDVMIFVALYAWGMSWRNPSQDGAAQFEMRAGGSVEKDPVASPWRERLRRASVAALAPATFLASLRMRWHGRTP